MLAVIAFSLYAGAAESQPYLGYEVDRQILRKTELIPQQNIKASSGKAVMAANRLFEKIHFVGMTREQVLVVLGDPRTISDYGVPAANVADSSLTYRFDTGWGGWEFSIEFKNERAIKLTKAGLN